MILFCNCGYSDIIPASVRAEILDELTTQKLDFEAVQDLCGLAAKRDPKLKRWAKADSLTIIACYPRTIKWLFRFAGVELDMEKTQFLNMRTSSAQEILSSLLSDKAPSSDKQVSQLEEKGQWIPWFPVIDHDLCKNCKQCMNFCLFGVYELSESGQVTVTNPAGCKTNCPACAKLCPYNAIIFPKFPDSPINGDEIDDNSKANANPNLVDGNDLYELLKKRTKNKKRFASDAPDKNQLDLKETLGIPSNVINSLSPSDIAKIRKKSEKPSE